LLMNCLANCAENSSGEKTDAGEDLGSQGSLLWAKGFGGVDVVNMGVDGSGSPVYLNILNEMGSTIVAMPDGSFIVGGSFPGTMTLDPGGTNETTLVADEGNPLDLDVFMARFAEDGALIWAKSIEADDDGTNMWDAMEGDYISDLVALTGESFAVIGHFEGTAVFGPGEPSETTLNTSKEDGEGFVASYRLDGTLAWARHLAGLWCLPDAIQGPSCFGAPRQDGGVAVVGSFEGEAEIASGMSDAVVVSGPDGSDLALSAFDVSGNLQWVKTVGRTSAEEVVHEVQGFASGGFFVSGSFYGDSLDTSQSSSVFGEGEANETVLDCDFRELKPGEPDGYCTFAFLARYDEDGYLVFAEPVADATLGVDSSLAVSEDAVLVAGALSGGYIMAPLAEIAVEMPGDYENQIGVVGLFGPDGEFRSASVAEGYLHPKAAAFLPDGSFALAGQVGEATLGGGETRETTLSASGCEGSADYLCRTSFAARYTADGALAWARILSAHGANDDFSSAANDIAVLPSGHLAIIGDFSGESVFGQSESNETTLSPNGLYDTFVTMYEP